MGYIMDARDEQMMELALELYQQEDFLKREKAKLKRKIEDCELLQSSNRGGREEELTELIYFKVALTIARAANKDVRDEISKLFRFFASRCLAVDGLRRVDPANGFSIMNFEKVFENYPEIYPKKCPVLPMSNIPQPIILLAICATEVRRIRSVKTDVGAYSKSLGPLKVYLVQCRFHRRGIALVFESGEGQAAVPMQIINKNWWFQFSRYLTNTIIWRQYALNAEGRGRSKKYYCTFPTEAKCKLFLAYADAVMKLLRYEAWKIIIDEQLIANHREAEARTGAEGVGETQGEVAEQQFTAAPVVDGHARGRKRKHDQS